MSHTAALHFPIVRFLNRVLSDYPAARGRLLAHQGKVIAVKIGPVKTLMRVSNGGEFELVGDTGDESVGTVADVSMLIALSLLPGLAAKDPEALAKITFCGDSELAATLSDIARNVEWDVEADLSRVVGDVVAHRVVDAAQRTNAWRAEAGQRLTANVAEYLTEERRAFISSRELEELARQNEALRDDIARLDARLSKLGLGR
jgi:ubiquinone biosynthesis protein UbiJ